MNQSSFDEISQLECVKNFLLKTVHTHEDLYNIPGISIENRRTMGMNGLYSPIPLVLKFRKMTKGLIGLEAISHFKNHLFTVGLGETGSSNLSVTIYLLSKKFLEDDLALYIL